MQTPQAPTPLTGAGPCGMRPPLPIPGGAEKPMAKPEWGVKRLCASCGERFYDLCRDPIACPACGAAFEIEAVTRGKRIRAVARAEPIDKLVEVDEADLVDDEDLPEDDDAAVLDEDEDDAVDPAVGAVAPVAAVEDEDDVIEADDDVLLEDEDDDVVEELGDLVEDEPEDDRNR